MESSNWPFFLRQVFFAAVFVVLGSTSVSALAAPADLSSWTAEGAGTWNIAGDNLSVTQTTNGSPTVFFTTTPSQGAMLSGTITVNDASDDDFVGFVIGYNAGDLANPSPDYLLLDWKKADQVDGGCMGPKGLALSHVTGAISAGGNGPWCHNTPSVSELARGITLGSTGWVDGTTYTFSITFTSTLIEVYVNGVKEISVPGAYANGGFGFYNYSQADVTYAGITLSQTATAVPLSGKALLPLALLVGLGAVVVGRRRFS